MRYNAKDRRPLGISRAAASLVGLILTLALASPAAAQSAAQSATQVARGAQLYARSCNRCHDVRSPMERTDREWATIIGHMRARANLTQADAEAILAFMQSTNLPEGGGSGASVGLTDPPRGGSASRVAAQEARRLEAMRRRSPGQLAEALPLEWAVLRYLASVSETGPVPPGGG